MYLTINHKQTIVTEIIRIDVIYYSRCRSVKM